MEKTTKSIYFDRKEVVPDDLQLRRALGEIYSVYEEILKLTEIHSHEWKCYGKKYGWQLKVMHKAKVLLYLTPLENSFRIGFAVREMEREALLKSKLSKKAKEELSQAKKYPEGYPLRFLVIRKSDMKPVRLVIEALNLMRS